MTTPPASDRTADSVRLALAGEARTIAEIQRRAWAQTLPAEVADALLGSLSLAEMTERWTSAILRPPEARFRVLVAVEDRRVLGFATTTPALDPDADPATEGAVDEVVVDPAGQRRGHGSRLLHACADTLRADGFSRATCWVPATDHVLRGFLESAGWAVDGAWREIGPEDGRVRLRQVRLHTGVAEPATG